MLIVGTETRRLAMTVEHFTMWFQDGGGRTFIYGRNELRQYAKKFSFDADAVIREGETAMYETFDGGTDSSITTIIGGVFKHD